MHSTTTLLSIYIDVYSDNFGTMQNVSRKNFKPVNSVYFNIYCMPYTEILVKRT